MKIAIPVVSDVKDTAVSDTFGRAAMFMVYDTEADASIYIQNKAALSSGGAGIQAAQTVVDSEVSVLLTPAGRQRGQGAKSCRHQAVQVPARSERAGEP